MQDLKKSFLMPFLRLPILIPGGPHSMGWCHLRMESSSWERVLEHSWEAWYRSAGVDTSYRSKLQDESGGPEKLVLQNPSQTERAGADSKWDWACGQNEILHPPEYLDKERQVMPSIGENVEQLRLSNLAGGGDHCHHHFGKWQVSPTIEHTPCLWPSYSTPR